MVVVRSNARQPSLTWLLAAAATRAAASRDAPVGHVSDARAARDARDCRRTRRRARRRCSRRSRGPVAVEREGALHLVAGAHAAPARDAELVPDRLMYGWRSSCVRLVRRRRASAARRRRGARPTVARARVCGARRLGQSERTSSTTLAATRRALRVLGRRPPSRRAPASCRRRPAARPSTPTRQTRQAPKGASRVVVAERRDEAARGARTSRSVAPGSTSTATPSTVTFTTRRVHRAPHLVGEVRDQAADRRGHAAAVRAEARDLERLEQLLEQRAVDRRRRASTISSPRVQRRRGTGSTCRSSRARRSASRCRASARMSVRSSKATMPPWPSMQPSAASGSKSNGVSSSDAGQDAAERPADLQRLERAPVAHPAAEALADLAQRRAERHLVDARPREALVQADELRAAALAEAERRVRLAAVRATIADVAERLDVVHDRRQRRGSRARPGTAAAR